MRHADQFGVPLTTGDFVAVVHNDPRRQRALRP
jgi:hypothetical protein